MANSKTQTELIALRVAVYWLIVRGLKAIAITRRNKNIYIRNVVLPLLNNNGPASSINEETVMRRGDTRYEISRGVSKPIIRLVIYPFFAVVAALSEVILLRAEFRGIITR